MTSVEVTAVETLPDGRMVPIWTVRNASGAGFTAMDLGATIRTLAAPDRAGRLADIVLGFDHAAAYLTHKAYFGAIVGRFANRIARGRFRLDGRDFTLAINDPPNSLHGGVVGFDKRMWRGERVTTQEGEGVCFSLTSEDGDEGYPGAVEVSVTYLWTDSNALVVGYRAATTATTPFNISQHTYWNLSAPMAERFLITSCRLPPTPTRRSTAR